MSKFFKKANYEQLLMLIFKFSNFDKTRAKILLEYVSYKIIENKFDVGYIDKLQYDLGIVLEDTPLKRNTCNTQMNKTFTHIELIEIKALLLDIVKEGYYA